MDTQKERHAQRETRRWTYRKRDTQREKEQADGHTERELEEISMTDRKKRGKHRKGTQKKAHIQNERGDT